MQIPANEFTSAQLKSLGWENAILRDDYARVFPMHESVAPAQLSSFGAAVKPQPPAKPKLLAYSNDCAAMLGLTEPAVKKPAFLQLLSGSQVIAGSTPYAMNYGGHQFGHWAGQLGDGRAINLFDLQTPTGRQSLQLKGAGPTAFSRRGDGFAVLRSSIREYLASEAMHALGVPTTRALCLIERGETVIRDMFYNGNPRAEPSATVCRVAPSFLRFGHFELLAKRGDLVRLKQLVVFAIRTYYPELNFYGEPNGVKQDLASGADLSDELIVGFFNEVCQRTAILFAHWQTLGFTHGVLNTDNMSIHGITLDYGPFGWLEPFDPHWTPNTTDSHQRRYAFGQQPRIALWNVWQLGNALAQITKVPAGLALILDDFQTTYTSVYTQKLAQKLALSQVKPTLIQAMETQFAEYQTDMVVYFRGLSALLQNWAKLNLESQNSAPHFLDKLQNSLTAALQLHLQESSYLPTSDTAAAATTEHDFSRMYAQQWLHSYWQDAQQTQQYLIGLNSVNPKYVPRNYMLHRVIQAAEQGDLLPLHAMQQLLTHPFVDQEPAFETQRRPAWALDSGCSALSCSS